MIFIIFLIALVGIIWFFLNNNNNNSEYEATRVATNDANNTTASETDNTTNSNNNIITGPSTTPETEHTPASEETPAPATAPEPAEEELTSFVTNIYTKETGRQHNMELTASRLDGIVVENNSVFSFCNTLGPSTPDKGYQKADIFDKSGNKQKGYGGGNCQISTTLYNAVLQAPGLEVVERHQHSNNVPYIAKGRDAAVAYGSYDFKFKNNTGSNVKIVTEVNTNTVKVSLVKLIQ